MNELEHARDIACRALETLASDEMLGYFDHGPSTQGHLDLWGVAIYNGPWAGHALDTAKPDDGF